MRLGQGQHLVVPEKPGASAAHQWEPGGRCFDALTRQENVA